MKKNSATLCTFAALIISSMISCGGNENGNLTSVSLTSSSTCGNNLVEANEVCDGNSVDCSSLEGADYVGGMAACNTTCDGFSEEKCSSFSRHVVAEKLEGAAFATVADLDSNGKNDIVISSFGNKLFMWGSVVGLYNNSGNISDSGNWEKKDIFSSLNRICFPNATQAHDIDDDGDLDLFVPSGFLACAANPLAFMTRWGLQWYENDNEKWVAHDIVKLGSKIDGNKLFFHKAEFVDIDNDGIKDVVTVGEMKTLNIFTKEKNEKAVTYWFKGTSMRNGDRNTRFDTTPRLIGEGGGSLPVAFDVNNDGNQDVVSAQYFGYSKDNASFVWFENNGSSWTKHRINQDDAGPAIQLSVVENLYGDNVTRLVGANHVNSTSNPEWPHEALYVFDVNSSNPSDFWPGQVVADEFKSRPNPKSGVQGAPGVFSYGDVDNDGDTDMIVSGDGDANIYFIEQIENGVFRTRILDGELGMSGEALGQAGVTVGDLNGDNVPEIVVSSYDAQKIIVYSLNK